MRAWITGALLTAAGCAGGRAPPPDGPSAARPAVAMPGPARGRTDTAVRSNAECEGCHVAEAAAWRGSLHARANVEASYRRAFAIEPMPFCRGCHAPEAIPTDEESEAVSALGVSCVTCHVTDDGAVLAAPRADGDERPAPHAVVRDARFAGPAACASCHEFAFPTAEVRPAMRDGDMMQTTMREHRASPASARACADCHMPREGRGRSHAFATSRDPRVVRSAVVVHAERIGPTKVRVTLRPSSPAHAFPTGDLFRRVEVVAEATGADTMVLGRDTRYLTRHFEPRRHGTGRTLTHDDRVFFDAREVELDVGVAAPISWRVAYQRVAHPRGVDDEDAEIDGEIVLGEGVLPLGGAR